MTEEWQEKEQTCGGLYHHYEIHPNAPSEVMALGCFFDQALRYSDLMIY